LRLQVECPAQGNEHRPGVFKGDTWGGRGATPKSADETSPQIYALMDITGTPIIVSTVGVSIKNWSAKSIYETTSCVRHKPPALQKLLIRRIIYIFDAAGVANAQRESVIILAFTEAPIIKPNKSTLELTAKLASFNDFSSTACIASPRSMLPDLPRTLDSLNLRVLRP
jgi:hypothetical protein